MNSIHNINNQNGVLKMLDRKNSLIYLLCTQINKLLLNKDVSDNINISYNFKINYIITKDIKEIYYMYQNKLFIKFIYNLNNELEDIKKNNDLKLSDIYDFIPNIENAWNKIYKSLDKFKNIDNLNNEIIIKLNQIYKINENYYSKNIFYVYSIKDSIDIKICKCNDLDNYICIFDLYIDQKKYQIKFISNNLILNYDLIDILLLNNYDEIFIKIKSLMFMILNEIIIKSLEHKPCLSDVMYA